MTRIFSRRRLFDCSVLLVILAVIAGIGRWIHQRQLSEYLSSASSEDEKSLQGTVPELIGTLRGSDRVAGAQAAEQLVQFGVMAVPHLIEALQDCEPHSRRSIVMVIGRMGSVAEAAVPALQELLSDSDDNLVQNSLHALQLIGPASQPAVEAISDLLQHPNGLVRFHAVRSLGGIGTPAISALRQALNHDDNSVRVGAALELIRLRPDAIETIPALCEVVQGYTADVRRDQAKAAFA